MIEEFDKCIVLVLQKEKSWRKAKSLREMKTCLSLLFEFRWERQEDELLRMTDQIAWSAERGLGKQQGEKRSYSSSNALEDIHSEELHNHIAEAVERIPLLPPVEVGIDHQ